MIIISKYLPKRVIGLAVFPFVFLKQKKMKGNKILVNHERIHLRQQIEMLIVFFFVFYGIEFVIRLIQYRNWNQAYKNISFEREAYFNEKTSNYLKSRSFWNFIDYL